MTTTAGPRPRISACVITLNEADRLGDCLASLGFCDEIVVVDRNSSDATVTLARCFGARVQQRHFDGYRSQKQFAVDMASHPWVLCLDADERISPELAGRRPDRCRTAAAPPLRLRRGAARTVPP